MLRNIKNFLTPKDLLNEDKILPDIIEPPKQFVLEVLNFEGHTSTLVRQYFNFFRRRKDLSLIKTRAEVNLTTASFWFYKECEDYAKEREWI